MRKWGPFVIAAVAVSADVVLGAIVAAQNAQVIGTIIPPRYLRPDYLLGGFGVGLMLVYFAARATHPTPAAIRLRFRLAQSLPLQVTNIGETEANEIQVM